MDGVELLPVEIAEALERGAIVVTGNQRAARTLRRGFDQRNRELGLASWAPAAVMAWDAWMAALWRGLLIEGHADADAAEPDAGARGVADDPGGG